MNAQSQPIIIAGAVLAFLGVAIGAFGAHALKARLAADMLAVYQTGVQYHLVHALGIVLIGILVQMLPASKWLPIAGWVMVAGVIIFSGSLYALSVTGVRILGAITPLGGIALLAAWVLVGIGVAKAGQLA
ncbi:MAG: DUF423 domain-containing protein [Betaproteobacteria bacterium]|nr:DUF423 domain-containing protein [Betaproteobacteria bacterium]